MLIKKKQKDNLARTLYMYTVRAQTNNLRPVDITYASAHDLLVHNTMYVEHHVWGIYVAVMETHIMSTHNTPDTVFAEED